MVGRDESLKEIVRGLEGLVMLGQWQVTLAKDLREKAEALGESGESPPAPTDASPQKSP
ncbi:MAG: hypothetical protein NTU94_13280 [Planctomycetota bacterium]|nr:hypothetical protein [Planctomycetota bacterium]